MFSMPLTFTLNPSRGTSSERGLRHKLRHNGWRHMPLVLLQARLDGQLKHWRSWMEVPVVLRVCAHTNHDLPGSRVVIYGLRTFRDFLECCSDASDRERDSLVYGLIDHMHVKMGGIYFEAATLAELVAGRLEMRQLHPAKKYRGWKF